MNSLQEKLQSFKNNSNLYKKEHKTFDEQLQILKNRDLIILNDDYVLTKLQHINYYRLSAYFLPFQHNRNSSDKNKFLPNTNFETIIELYYFDVELRKIIFEAIESIEIHFRTQIAYYHAKSYKPLGYLEKENFKTSEKFYSKVLGNFKNESNRSEEEFIKHFENKYRTTDLPIWTLVEVISFGTLSKLYTMLKTDEQKEVTKKLNGINNNVFQNWLHTLSVIRNICAHHSRLWNKTLGVKFEIPRKIKSFNQIKNERNMFMNDKIFFALSVIEYILTSIGEDEIDFKHKIKKLLKKYPNIDKNAMGFIDSWEELDIWK